MPAIFPAERDPQQLLVALNRLAVSCGPEPGIQLEIIGVADSCLQRTVQEYGLSRIVQFSGSLSYLDTLSRLAASTMLLVLEAPCLAGIFLLSKVADYVQFDKPVLAVSPRDGVLRDILEQHSAGIAVDCTSVDSIYVGLKELYDAWKARSLASYSVNSLRAQFSAHTVLQTYETVFQSARSFD